MSPKTRTIALRAVTFAILFLSAFILPSWATFVLAAAAAFWFEDFYELIFFGVLLDAVYGGGAYSGMFLHSLFYTLLSIALFGSILILKKRLIFYER